MTQRTQAVERAAKSGNPGYRRRRRRRHSGRVGADTTLGRFSEIEADGGVGLALTCDIRDSAAVDAAVAKVVQRFGTVDILVNNANAARGGVRFEDISDDELELVFRTGPMATIFLMRAWFRYLKDGYGRVINLRSGSELVGMRGFGAYIAGKGAIGGLS